MTVKKPFAYPWVDRVLERLVALYGLALEDMFPSSSMLELSLLSLVSYNFEMNMSPELRLISVLSTASEDQLRQIGT